MVLLTSSGVGYKVFVPTSVAKKIKLGASCELWIHTHVREDQISLFGFASKQDLDAFELLITVSGVGPKTAMNIFNAGNGEDIRAAIFQQNKMFFKGVSGLGTKTIEKIFIELKNKVSRTSYSMNQSLITNNLEEAFSALQNLGYQRNEIFDFFKREKGIEEKKVEEIVKKFLKK